MLQYIAKRQEIEMGGVRHRGRKGWKWFRQGWDQPGDAEGPWPAARGCGTTRAAGPPLRRDRRWKWPARGSSGCSWAETINFILFINILRILMRKLRTQETRGSEGNHYTDSGPPCLWVLHLRIQPTLDCRLKIFGKKNSQSKHFRGD